MNPDRKIVYRFYDLSSEDQLEALRAVLPDEDFTNWKGNSIYLQEIANRGLKAELWEAIEKRQPLRLANPYW